MNIFNVFCDNNCLKGYKIKYNKRKLVFVKGRGVNFILNINFHKIQQFR